MSTIPAIEIQHPKVSLDCQVYYNEFDVFDNADEEFPFDHRDQTQVSFWITFNLEGAVGFVAENKVSGCLIFDKKSFRGFREDHNLPRKEAVDLTSAVINLVADHALSYLPKVGGRDWKVIRVSLGGFDDDYIQFYSRDPELPEDAHCRHEVGPDDPNFHGFAEYYLPRGVHNRLAPEGPLYQRSN